jgi:polysaccharide deacetylase family protein (PEP-CTERM system associated)
MSDRAANPIRNALGVEVVDWFQFDNRSAALDPARWETLPSRVEDNVERLLALFRLRRITATFFVLGWLADRLPEMVQKIAAAGHEIASLGYSNLSIALRQPDEFRDDLICAKAILENLTGREVTGYRAAGFSLTEKTPWAHAAVADAGYRYSSSVRPLLTLRKNAAEPPRFPYRARDGLLEIPQSAVRMFNRSVPINSGARFRLFPYNASRWMIQRLNEVDQAPLLFHLSAWEIDPAQPKVAGLGLRSRVAHYAGLRRNFWHLDRLLQDFRWGRIDDTFAEQIASVPVWSRSRQAPVEIGYQSGLLTH